MSGFLWIKSLHLVAVVSWMAGLLYLPRLFVYHAVKAAGSDASEMLKTMEYRLLAYIMTPAMIVVWLSGVHLAVSAGYWTQGWFLLKVAFAVVMTAAHFLLSWHRKMFFRDENLMSQKYFRILNEVPTLLMIFIVILVVVRPF